MRLNLVISPSQTIVPFNHLPVLVGALHKWLGPNEEHGELSLYTFSWLQGGRYSPQGLSFPHGARWFISALNDHFLTRSISGIFRDPVIRWGMQVERVEVIAAPIFPNGVSEQRFLVASPVFASRSIPNLDKKSGYEKKHYLFSDPESDALLTETLQHKLTVAGLPAAGATVRFDRTSRQAKSQKVTYRDIENMCSYCPVFIKGTPEQLSFAWTVGVGNSTGIGLGSLYLPDPTTPTLASQKNNSLHPNHSHQ